jgi:hypothetical protein
MSLCTRVRWHGHCTGGPSRGAGHQSRGQALKHGAAAGEQRWWRQRRAQQGEAHVSPATVCCTATATTAPAHHSPRGCCGVCTNGPRAPGWVVRHWLMLATSALAHTSLACRADALHWHCTALPFTRMSIRNPASCWLSMILAWASPCASTSARATSRGPSTSGAGSSRARAGPAPRRRTCRCDSPHSQMCFCSMHAYFTTCTRL